MRTTSRLSVLTTALVAAAVVMPFQAQGQAASASASPAVIEALLRDIAMLEGKLVGLVDAIPEDKYDWRPGEGVRSVREVIMHVAADNYFLPTFAGMDAPAASGIKTGDYPSVQAYEKRNATKAVALQELRASFAHLRSAMEMADDAFLSQSLDVFGTKMSGLDLAVMTTTHLHEHLGQAIAYARSNGIAPPWSRGG